MSSNNFLNNNARMVVPARATNNYAFLGVNLFAHPGSFFNSLLCEQVRKMYQPKSNNAVSGAISISNNHFTALQPMCG